MYLGIDISMSSGKALLIGDNQASIGAAAAPLQVSRMHAGDLEPQPRSGRQEYLENLINRFV